MSNMMRRMRRNQRNKERPLEVEVYVKDGLLSVSMSVGDWKGGPSFGNCGLPDGDLPWIADKILDAIRQAVPDCHCDLCRIAHQVIEEEVG